MSNSVSKSYKRILSTLVPALASVTVYALAFKPKAEDRYSNLPGKPLASYVDLYPVQSDSEGHLYLDKRRFVKVVEFLSENSSPKAISDLIYLGKPITSRCC